VPLLTESTGLTAANDVSAEIITLRPRAFMEPASDASDAFTKATANWLAHRNPRRKQPKPSELWWHTRLQDAAIYGTPRTWPAWAFTADLSTSLSAHADGAPIRYSVEVGRLFARLGINRAFRRVNGERQSGFIIPPLAAARACFITEVAKPEYFSHVR
jgi:hypothetical protein